MQDPLKPLPLKPQDRPPVDPPAPPRPDRPAPPPSEDPTPVPVEPTVRRDPRITVVSRVVHQTPGEQPQSPPQARFFRWLESEEEPYRRAVKVGEGWVPLDLGWVGKECSLLVLQNATKTAFALRPTREELEEVFGRVLEVGILVGGKGDGTDRVEDFAEIPVGEDLRLSPRKLDRYRVRCVSGEGKYYVFAVPV